MTVLTHTCPHCASERQGFQIVHTYEDPRAGISKIASRTTPSATSLQWAFGICPGCGAGVTIRVEVRPQKTFTSINGDLATAPEVAKFTVFPALTALALPEHLPPRVAALFAQAAEAHRRAHLDAARAVFGMTLETALKILSPNEQVGRLVDRINKMVSDGRLPKDMGDWAHAVRLERNEMHEVDEATAADVEQLHYLVEYLLIYLFTMPEKVRIARELRNPPA